MKRKPKNKGRQTIKIEKRTKIMKKEEIDALFSKDQEGSKRKESSQKICQNKPLKQQTSNSNKVENKTQKETSINIFTEGISYEKIDHNKYKQALTNFNHLFGKDLNKINKNKKGIEKNDKNVQISKSYLYERALYKDIEIEINLENNNNKIIKDAKKIILLLNNFLNSEKNFFYYEFSNTRNISFNKLSEGDFLLYKSFIKEFDNLDNNSRNKEDYIKQLDYVNTMINLYYKFNINKKTFYIMTPLYSLSFDYNKEIPLLLTNSKTLEIELNKNDIKIIKIKTKLGKNKLDINNNKEEKTKIKWNKDLDLKLIEYYFENIKEDKSNMDEIIDNLKNKELKEINVNDNNIDKISSKDIKHRLHKLKVYKGKKRAMKKYNKIYNITNESNSDNENENEGYEIKYY